MGGYGSGRPGYKQKAEQCRSLDVNRLHREGCLTVGQRGNWVWSLDGVEEGRIGYSFADGGLTLDYRVRQFGGDWEPITENIQLARVACNYGGERPFFICPGVVNGHACQRRVGKLFSGGKYFLCRHCYDVVYSSQSESGYDRLLRRANKLRIALGGEPGTAYFIAPKPQGMWNRSYKRMVDEIDRLESQANTAFLSKFGHTFSKDELQMYFGPSPIAE